LSRNDSSPPTFDPVWDRLYCDGQENRYPWDAVVSFVFNHRPADKTPEQTRIIEVGCGTAPNLWFAAREGFSVSGIDGSEVAIAKARERFREDGLAGDLRAGDFTALPFDSGQFDLAIDRAALTTCGLSAACRAIAEVHRVLAPGAVFFCNPYSRHHNSAESGEPGDDGLSVAISSGTLKGAGQICFYDRDTLLGQFPETQWRILTLDHMELSPHIPDAGCVSAEWRLIAEKI
jgi:SAM-dependent methyltransferase